MKKIIIIFLIFSIVLSSYTCCFATTVSMPGDIPDINYSDEYICFYADNNYYYISHTNTGYNTAAAHYPLSSYNSNNKMYMTAAWGNANLYKLVDGAWSYQRNSPQVVTLNSTEKPIVIASSTDVYALDGNVVFQKPLRQFQMIKSIYLAVLDPIRPILPMMVTALVAIVAFWKGWGLLSIALHRP